MSMNISALPKGTAYTGNIECDFHTDGKKIKVELKTEDLYLRSVKKEDIPHYIKLWGDSEVMKNFSTGAIKSPEDTAKRVRDSYIQKWKDGNPFSAFAIYTSDKSAFVGHVVLGAGEYSGFDDKKDSGYSEMAGMGYPKYWNNGLGNQAAAAIVKGYAPELKQREHQVSTVVEGKVEMRPFNWICATARIDKNEDNEFYSNASIKILTGLGFELFNESNKFGNFRGHFGLKV